MNKAGRRFSWGRSAISSVLIRPMESASPRLSELISLSNAEWAVQLKAVAEK
jgi:hypothetical protein